MLPLHERHQLIKKRLQPRAARLFASPRSISHSPRGSKPRSFKWRICLNLSNCVGCLEMYMPSSPPSLPEEIYHEPPSSPPLPPATFPSRKRHADYESSLSSDPIFSEDASEESDLNGVFKKKKYTKGPWYNHAPSHLRPSSVASSPLNKDSVR